MKHRLAMPGHVPATHALMHAQAHKVKMETEVRREGGEINVAPEEGTFFFSKATRWRKSEMKGVNS